MDIQKLRQTLGKRPVIWLCRIIVGAVFVVSGWAKAVDPWGFVYKIEDYLTVWQITQPRELVVCVAIALASVEFLVGVCALTGMLRRFTLWVSAAIMAFMLPLTVWIAVADPVSDCGCFGDLLVISNSMTLLKNIVVSLAIAVLFLGRNRCVTSLFTPSIQWLAVTLSAMYVLALAVTGYNIQPLVDFRPYPTGTDLGRIMTDANATDAEAESIRFVYSRDGVESEFGIDNLPDSSWTYVRRVEADVKQQQLKSGGSFAVFDEDGDDVGPYVISTDTPQLLVVVSNPGLHYLSRARLVNDLAYIVKSGGGSVVGLVGSPTEVVEQWAGLALPDFDIYSAEDTRLKTLVRGDASLVMLDKGVIKWKRTVESLDADFCEQNPQLSNVLALEPVDDGRWIYKLTGLYLLLMLLCSTLNVAPRIRRYFRHRQNHKPTAAIKQD